jgi:signal transduction histidine kinase/ligand-binding sensor domain-containing protein/DNA-binding response OmpR family regulator
MKHCLLAITICVCVLLRVHAQQVSYPFTRLDVRQGLSHNEVNAIFKDARGFMWFATMSGLDRYDGHDFRVFRYEQGNPSSIGENTTHNIMEGPDGKLWIQFWDDSLNIYNPTTETFDRNASGALKGLGVPASGLLNILKDKEGTYWFVHPLGLYRYDPSSKRTILVLPPASDPSVTADPISDFRDDGHGHYWIVRHSGLLEEVGVNGSGLINSIWDISQTERNHLGSGYVLFVDEQGELWLHCTTGARGIWYIQPGTKKIWHLESGKSMAPHLDNDIVAGVIQDEHGLIWVGTDHGGINLISKANLSVTWLLHNDYDDNSIGQNAIICMYKDNTGIVWMGTHKQGISYYCPGSMRFPWYKHRPMDPHSLSCDDINRFVEDRRGNLWIGTNEGGLIYFDRKSGYFTTYVHQPDNPNSVSSNIIISLCMDHLGRLWIGSYYGGLDCYDGKRFVHYKHNPLDSNSLADDRIWEIFEDHKQQLWIGTLAGGLDVLDQVHQTFLHHRKGDIPRTVSVNYISELTEDKEGRLWVGTNAGIDAFNPNTGLWSHYAKKDGLSNDDIIALKTDSLGRLWVGTGDGLNLMDPQSGKVLKTWTKKDGLPDNYIQTIAEDNQHNLWIGTPNGLSNGWVGPGGDPMNPHLTFINYDASSGLQSAQFNENAALRTREGEMVFGGPFGFNIFKPQAPNGTTQAPPLIFTDLQVFNQSVAPGERVRGRVLLKTALPQTQEVELGYNDNVFSISFADLDYSINQKVNYAYRLDGFNQDWLNMVSGQRSATFTNLDPGTYHFRVRATPAGGMGSPREAALTIHILPPFWKTPWAFVVYVLVALGLLWLARNILVERTRMRFRIEQERQKAEDLHELDMMKIRFFTNVSHEFRTPLSLILAPMEKLLKQPGSGDQHKQFQLIYRNARRLLNLVNQLLDFRKMEVQEFRLQPSKDDVIRFVKDLTQSFSDISEKRHVQLDFESNVESAQANFDRDKVEKIVFNLLSNAFKFTPEGGKVLVAVKVEGRILELRVSDTGIGIPPEQVDRIFERFFQHDLPGHIINQGTGIGLSLTKEFVKLHTGSIEVVSEIEKGSSFIVRLPIIEVEVHPLAQQVVRRSANGHALEETDLMAERLEERGESEPDIEGSPRKSKKPILLIVEDNEDFRFYLKDNLRNTYQVVEASDGKEGWAKIQAAQPDLVVSDIMMPGMNGITLAKKIKNDPRLSHIPVILLTARAAEEQQLEGYSSGANDYITKPFNFELLQAKIRNLLAQRKAVHKLFQKQAEINPSSVSITPLDEQFIAQAIAIVEQHISEPEFSVEDLSRALHFSRVTLYKKLLSLTGKAPLDFIRHIRLKRATELLSKSQMTVAEIAYEVGFNDPKYFARSFIKEFGIKPSAYKKKVE